jgi:hypothetical protein
MSDPKTCALEAPGAVLCYDVREGGWRRGAAGAEPPGRIPARPVCRVSLTRSACAEVYPPWGR